MLKKNIERIFILSDAQKGILYQHLAGASDIYTEIVCLKLAQWPDMEQLRIAWQRVVDNNQILRSYVQWERVSAPVLIMACHKTVSIELKQGSGDINRILQEERTKGIQIDQEAMRLVLYSIEDDGVYMLMISHHIFLDGWSTGIILDEWHRAF
ncbi:MAG: condensation domain-containing protein, partial [Clostridiales bacterium]|nr:condensation domain-containing protein [Clostridiales bacterium]